MLNFRDSTIALVLVWSVMAAFGIYRDIPLPYFLIPIVLYIGCIVLGSAWIGSNFFMKVASIGDETEPEVAITFDDGPAAASTSKILDILKESNTPAAFFCIGSKVNENPELVKRIFNEGHIVGNHSFSHGFFFDFYSHNSMVREIRTTNRAIEKVIQKRTYFFRPPYGVTTPVLARAVKTAKVSAVGWSLRSMDTVTKSPEKLIDKINQKIKGGDIILLHDTNEVTVEALPQIIEEIRSSGYTIVRLDKLLNMNAYG